MPVFLVKFDDMAFTSSKKDTWLELKAKNIVKLNTELKEEGMLTADLLGVVSVTASNDDGKQDGEYKVFTSVVVRVQAKSEAAAEAFKTPTALLEKALEHLKATHKGGSLENEGNWEVLDTDLDTDFDSPLPTQAAGATEKSKKSAFRP